MACAGDIQAIKEIADRIDGRAKIAIVGGEEDDAPVRTEIVWRVVDPREQLGPRYEAPRPGREDVPSNGAGRPAGWLD